jgi:hypothetical protein
VKNERVRRRKRTSEKNVDVDVDVYTTKDITSSHLKTLKQ